MGRERAGNCFQRNTRRPLTIAINCLFCELHGQGRIGRNLLSKFICASVQLIEWKDFVDQPPSFSSCSRNALSGKDHLFGAATADQGGQSSRTAPTWNRGDRYLRKPEFNGISGETNIGGQGKFQATAQSKAV